MNSVALLNTVFRTVVTRKDMHSERSRGMESGSWGQGYEFGAFSALRGIESQIRLLAEREGIDLEA